MGSQPILPALPNPGDSGMNKAEAKEFGSALADIRYLSRQVNDFHSELREHMQHEDRMNDEFTKSLNVAHGKIKTINTHLAWMKGVWAAVQVSVLSLLGFKQ